MENLHWEGPPGTVQQLGQLRAVLMCWAMLSSVFVLEYYLDTLWKGTLLFIVCLVLVCSDVLSTVRAPAPHPPLPWHEGHTEAPARAHLPVNPWCPQVQEQETWCFSLYGMAIGLWLMVSSIPRRRLVLNHTRGMYHFSISGRTVCQGPMHLVYVRLALSSDGDAWDRRGERERDVDSELGGANSPSGHSHLGGPTPTILRPTPRLREVRFLAQLLICWQSMAGASSSWFFVATS